ncbi:MAG: MFS transporter [Acidobacteriia bacterium]|nr:MFS transporter [Terriglobia bacterium]
MTDVNRNRAIPFSIGLGTMIAALHASGMNAAFPVIAQQTGASVAGAQWILTVYTLALSGCLLTFGRLGDRAGLRGVYLGGLAAFTIASAACALAPNLVTLVVLRGIEGVGAAMISATSAAILARHLPASRLGQALGWQAGMTYFGLALGPALAGFVAEQYGWRALFLMNLPLGAIAMIVAARVLESVSCRPRLTKFNGLESLAWIATLVPLMVALSGWQPGGWLSLRTTILGAATCVCCAAFVVINRRSADPLIRFAVFRRAAFSAATLAETVYYVCLYATGFLMPLYLMRARGFGAAETGFFVACQCLARAMAAPIGGRLTDRSGVRIPTGLGVVILGIGMLCLCRLDSGTSAVQVGATLVLVGIGTGLFVPANSTSLLGSAPTELYGMAGSILATARNLGMTLGVAIAAAMYTVSAPGEAAGAAAAIAGVRGAFTVVAALAVVNAIGFILASVNWAPGGADRVPEPS